MTKEEMFKEMEKMAPVLERNGVDIVLKKNPRFFLREAIFSTRKRVCGRCIPAGSEMNILYGSRPARSRRRWKSCTAWQSMNMNQPCGIWNGSGKEKRECRTGRNEPAAKQKGKRARFPFCFPHGMSEVEWMRMTKHAGDLVPHRRKDRKSE